jgi:hypothetical protein
MNLQLPEEVRKALNKELNPFERLVDLFKSGDDRQDLMLCLLYEIAQLLANQSPAGGSTEFPSGLLANLSLGVNPFAVLDNVQALTTDEIIPQKLANCRRSLRAVVYVNNGFDQQVSVKVVNNNSESPGDAFTVHTFNVAANDRGAYGLRFQDWMPYVGCTVTPAVNPTAGALSAVVIRQEQVEST